MFVFCLKPKRFEKKKQIQSRFFFFCEARVRLRIILCEFMKRFVFFFLYSKKKKNKHVTTMSVSYRAFFFIFARIMLYVSQIVFRVSFQGGKENEPCKQILFLLIPEKQECRNALLDLWM